MKINFTEQLLRIYENEKKKTDYTPLQAFPSLLCESVTCIEDHRFYDHGGVDLIAIIRALLTNILNLRIIEGGSTITQQLVRKLILTKEKSLRRKFLEITLALSLERRLSKQEILEFYLNTCYFLSIDRLDIYGVHYAAKGIFDKDCRKINLAEASFLAALIGRPLTNNSSLHFVMRTICRQHLILQYLLGYGKISKSDFDMATNENIKIFTHYKNDYPVERIREYSPHYIKPFYFIKPFLRVIRLLKRTIRTLRRIFCYYPIIFRVSRRYMLPFSLIREVIYAESSFMEKAVSTKNAKGLMQVIDATFLYVNEKHHKRWQINDIFKPVVNIEAGTLYLKEMLDYFTMRVEVGYGLHYALAAYNAGPHNVDKVISLIITYGLKKDWDSLKQLLPDITHRYALYTIKYVESVVSRIDVRNDHFVSNNKTIFLKC